MILFGWHRAQGTQGAKRRSSAKRKGKGHRAQSTGCLQTFLQKLIMWFFFVPLVLLN